MNHVLLILSATVIFTAACGPKNPKGGKDDEGTLPSIVEKTLPDGLVLQEVDLNNDGRPEIFNYYRERSDAPRLLVRKDADLNRDGNVDIKSWFNDFGMLELEEMDGDFDGQIDLWDHYQDTDGDKSAERVSSEVDTDYDGKPDVFTYFRNGKVIRKERDTNGDDRVDHWEKFDESGNVVKSGRDTNFDGIVDERDT
jgi:antitoxin component YwqK of YwqJK toxin-antitoxin module